MINQKQTFWVLHSNTKSPMGKNEMHNLLTRKGQKSESVLIFKTQGPLLVTEIEGLEQN